MPMQKSFLFSPSDKRTPILYLGTVAFGISKLLFLMPDALYQTAGQLDWDQGQLGLLYFCLFIAAVVVLILARRGFVLAGARLLAGLLLVDGAVYLLAGTWESPRGWAAIWSAIVIGGLLLDSRSTAVITAISSLVASLSALRSDDLLAVYFASVLWILVLGAVIVLAGQLRAVVGSEVAAQKDEPQILIEIGQEITQGVFARQDVDTFLGHIVESIQKQFPVTDHVEIFLIEPGSQYATLHAATGVVGEQLLVQEYRHDIGGLSLVGRVTLSGEPALIADLNLDPIHRPHPLLPAIRCELAIPLVAKDTVIGALDVQSTEPGALDETDVKLLRAIAAQIAMAVDDIHVYEAAQRNIRENEALYQQAQASLREIERLNYQLTGRAWADYLCTQAEMTAITLDLETGQTLSEAEWTATLNEAASQNKVVVTNVDGRQVVAVPIVVRNEAIGAMEFELEPDNELQEGALDLIATVGQRLGLAMENRRLFDETQRAAQREALINDIGAKLQAATGVDAILQQAARQLQEALSAQQVTIRLGVAPTESRGQVVQERPKA